MCPEAATGHSGEARPAFDQYSLGVTLYELLCGHTPFSGPPEVVLYNVVHRPTMPPPSERKPGLSRDLEAVCLKALARAPEGRYPTCRHLADDLRRWLAGEPVSVRPPGRAELFRRWLRRNPSLAAALGLATLCLVAVMVVLARHAHEQQRSREGADLARNVADELTEIARKEREIARKERVDADRARILAEENGKTAERESKEAEKARQEEAKARKQAEKARQEEAKARKQAEKARQEVAGLLDGARVEQYFTLMGLVEREMRDGNVRRARQLLESAPAKVEKGWEYRHLASELAKRSQRDLRLASMAFRPPDDRWLAWGHGNTVVLRRYTPTATRERKKAEEKEKKAVRVYSAPGQVRCLAFSRTGRYLAVGCDSGDVRVWDLGTTANKVPEKAGVVIDYKHTGRVNDLAFRLDEKKLASVGEDRIVQLLDLPRARARLGKPVGPLPRLHENELRAVLFAPDGKLFTFCSQPRVVVSDPETGKEVATWGSFLCGTIHPRTETFTETFKGPLLSPLPRYKIGARENGTVSVYDLENRPVCHFREHGADVLRLLSSVSGRLASGDEDGVVKVWEVKNSALNKDKKEDKEAVEQYGCHTAGGFAFGNKGDDLAWLGADGVVYQRWLKGAQPTRAYAADTGQDAKPEGDKSLAAYADYTHTLAYTPKGEFLVTGSSIGSDRPNVAEGGEMRLWNLETGLLERSSANQTTPIYAVACGPKGKLAWAGRSRRVWWSGDGVEGERSFDANTGPDPKAARVNGLAFTPNGNSLVIGGTGGVEVLTLDAKGAGTSRPLETTTKSEALAVAVTGKLVASGHADGSVFLTPLDGGGAPRRLGKHAGPVRGLCFSPDGSLLASAGDDHLIRLWDVKGGGCDRALKGHTAAVEAVAFSPDGKRLASCSRDRTVRLWEPSTGREALSLLGRSGLRNGVAFLPGRGEQLAAASVLGVPDAHAPEPVKPKK
jgi:WD40 repeat protein